MRTVFGAPSFSNTKFGKQGSCSQLLECWHPLPSRPLSGTRRAGKQVVSTNRQRDRARRGEFRLPWHRTKGSVMRPVNIASKKPSMPPPGMILWKSSKNATDAAPRRSPLSFPSTDGPKSLAIRPMPTPAWTVSFTPPTASGSPAKACAGPEESKPRKVNQPPLPMPENRARAPRRFEIGTVGEMISESWARWDWNRRTN